MTLKRSPLLTFLLAAVLLVGTLVSVSGLVATRFFQHAILERESQLVNELASSLLAEPDEGEATLTAGFLDKQLHHLLALDEILRINVFSADKHLVWSSESDIIGRRARNDAPLGRALSGDVVPVAQPFQRTSHRDWNPKADVMEVYVPIRSAGDSQPLGAMGIYRDAGQINHTLTRGAMLIWSSAGLVGVLLIAIITTLHGMLLHRHRAALASLGSLDEKHRRIVQLEKMSALGKMVGEIAHQVNSPLVGVVNKAQLAARRLDDPEKIKGYLRDIEAAGKHCAEFVKRLLDLSRVSRFEKEAVDLKRVVQEAVQLVSQGSGLGGTIALALPARDARVEADPVLLRHALFNLLRNATAVSPADESVTVRLFFSDTKHCWCIDVEDQGPGVPEAMREQIFQPFFTTSRDGNGLGLAVASTVANLHGGTLEVMDGNEGGALFRLAIAASPTGSRTEAGS